MTPRCPHCHQPTRTGLLDGVTPVSVCLPCDWVAPAPGPLSPPAGGATEAAQRHGDAPQAGRGTSVGGRARQRPEDPVVQDVCRVLIGAGYLCLRAGQWRADRSGSDPGVPDILAVRPGSGGRGWLIECKAPEGKPTPVQSLLARHGCVIVVRSGVEALAALEGE